MTKEFASMNSENVASKSNNSGRSSVDVIQRALLEAFVSNPNPEELDRNRRTYNSDEGMIEWLYQSGYTAGIHNFFSYYLPKEVKEIMDQWNDIELNLFEAKQRQPFLQTILGYVELLHRTNSDDDNYHKVSRTVRNYVFNKQVSFAEIETLVNFLHDNFSFLFEKLSNREKGVEFDYDAITLMQLAGVQEQGVKIVFSLFTGATQRGKSIQPFIIKAYIDARRRKSQLRKSLVEKRSDPIYETLVAARYYGIYAEHTQPLARDIQVDRLLDIVSPYLEGTRVKFKRIVRHVSYTHAKQIFFLLNQEFHSGALQKYNYWGGHIAWLNDHGFGMNGRNVGIQALLALTPISIREAMSEWTNQKASVLLIEKVGKQLINDFSNPDLVSRYNAPTGQLLWLMEKNIRMNLQDFWSLIPIEVKKKLPQWRVIHHTYENAQKQLNLFYDLRNLVEKFKSPSQVEITTEAKLQEYLWGDGSSPEQTILLIAHLREKPFIIRDIFSHSSRYQKSYTEVLESLQLKTGLNERSIDFVFYITTGHLLAWGKKRFISEIKVLLERDFGSENPDREENVKKYNTFTGQAKWLKDNRIVTNPHLFWTLAVTSEIRAQLSEWYSSPLGTSKEMKKRIKPISILKKTIEDVFLHKELTLPPHFDRFLRGYVWSSDTTIEELQRMTEYFLNDPFYVGEMVEGLWKRQEKLSEVMGDLEAQTGLSGRALRVVFYIEKGRQLEKVDYEYAFVPEYLRNYFADPQQIQKYNYSDGQVRWLIEQDNPLFQKIHLAAFWRYIPAELKEKLDQWHFIPWTNQEARHRFDMAIGLRKFVRFINPESTSEKIQRSNERSIRWYVWRMEKDSTKIHLVLHYLEQNPFLLQEKIEKLLMLGIPYHETIAQVTAETGLSEASIGLVYSLTMGYLWRFLEKSHTRKLKELLVIELKKVIYSVCEVPEDALGRINSSVGTYVWKKVKEIAQIKQALKYLEQNPFFIREELNNFHVLGTSYTEAINRISNETGLSEASIGFIYTVTGGTTGHSWRYIEKRFSKESLNPMDLSEYAFSLTNDVDFDDLQRDVTDEQNSNIEGEYAFNSLIEYIIETYPNYAKQVLRFLGIDSDSDKLISVESDTENLDSDELSSEIIITLAQDSKIRNYFAE